jgi:hypothetical protein
MMFSGKNNGGFYKKFNFLILKVPFRGFRGKTDR